jgi:predicted MFS family arabinose efflux permease
VKSEAFRWRPVLAAAATDTVSILPGFMTAGLAVQIRDDIGLSLSALGVSIGVFFGSAAVASAPAGRLVERIGWTRSLKVAALLAATSMVGVALLVQSVPVLYLLFALAGLASALAHPAANLTVARCVPIDRHGFLFGVKHAAVPTATLLGGLAVPGVALTLGWRWAFIGGALLALAAMTAVPRTSDGYVVNPAASGRRRIAGKPTDLKLLVILALAVGLGIAGIDALASFIVSYSVDIGIAEGTAGLILAAGSAAGIIARLIAGWAIDRHRNADLTTVAAMLVAGAAGVAMLTGGLLAFAGGWGWSGLFTFAIVKDHPEAPAAATAITQSGKLVGAAAGPALFGVIAESYSFRAAWWATVAVLLTGAAMMLIIDQRRPTHPTAQP